MGNMKVVINKFVILPKLRQEVGQVEFSLKKWRVAGSPHKVRTRMGQLWPKRKQSGVST